MNVYPTASSAPPIVLRSCGWQADGLKIVEDLFPVTASENWNLLLDLRQSLFQGTDWEQTLDLFLTCRQAMETSHYLPFYRLRRILAGSLQLAAKGDPTGLQSLEEVLRRNHRSLADLKRSVCRDNFEHGRETLAAPGDLRVVETGFR